MHLVQRFWQDQLWCRSHGGSDEVNQLEDQGSGLEETSGDERGPFATVNRQTRRSSADEMRAEPLRWLPAMMESQIYTKDDPGLPLCFSQIKRNRAKGRKGKEENVTSRVEMSR